MEADKGSLTAYFRLRGEVSVLGLISASIELYLVADLRLSSGSRIGTATITVKVKVLCFSKSVSITSPAPFRRSNGDPTSPRRDGRAARTSPSPLWTDYRSAFAEKEMREQFTVVALPYSCSPDADYHVSLFVSPDIEVDDPRDTLAVTEPFQALDQSLGRGEVRARGRPGRTGSASPCSAPSKTDCGRRCFRPRPRWTSYTPPGVVAAALAHRLHPGTTTIAKLAST